MKKKSLIFGLQPTLTVLLKEEPPETWPCYSVLSIHAGLNYSAALA